MKDLLLHACCAPCLSGTLLYLKQGNYFNIDLSIACFWFNPNIHPLVEYRARLNSLRDFAGQNNIKLYEKNYYGLREFTKNVINNLDTRCLYCYETRLEQTAKFAAENDFKAFSTTLLVSPYQNHEKIKEIGEKYANIYGIKFFYGDYRLNFREGQKIARENNIYMQKYCGCIFSEEERFMNKK